MQVVVRPTVGTWPRVRAKVNVSPFLVSVLATTCVVLSHFAVTLHTDVCFMFGSRTKNLAHEFCTVAEQWLHLTARYHGGTK